MTTQQVERRAFGTLELRAGAAGKGATLAGHAAVFNLLSEDLGGFREKVDAGAFDETLARDDVVALWNHDANVVLGRSSAGTLRLAKDERGLAVEIDPPDSSGGRDLVVAVGRGDVKQMSFGFRTLKDSWERVQKDGGAVEEIRTLLKVRLFDVSPVTFPAYPQTDVAVRSREEWRVSLNRDPHPDPLLARERVERGRRLDLLEREGEP